MFMCGHIILFYIILYVLYFYYVYYTYIKLYIAYLFMCAIYLFHRPIHLPPKSEMFHTHQGIPSLNTSKFTLSFPYLGQPPTCSSPVFWDSCLFFSKHTAFGIPSVYCMWQSLVPFHWWVVSGCMDASNICLLIQPVTDIWVVFSIFLLKLSCYLSVIGICVEHSFYLSGTHCSVCFFVFA